MAAAPSLPRRVLTAQISPARCKHASPVQRGMQGWAPGRCPTRAAASAEGDAEVAVFRFTLGNDELDALVPRIVGAASAALLLLNHLLLAETPTEAQVRAETLGAALAALAAVTPTLEQRLRELQPGRGRLAAASSVQGATSVFALPAELPEAEKQELAWASYALLRNSNICGLAVFWGGRAVLARGLLAVPQSGPPGALDAAAVLAALSSTRLAPDSTSWRQGSLYCPDKAAAASAGAAAWGPVPSGAEAVLVQPLQPLGSPPASQAAAFLGSSNVRRGAGGAARGVLLLVSERPRALSAKERGWAAAVAAKLYDVLHDH